MPGGLIVRTFWDAQHVCLVRSERPHDLAMTAATVILMLAIASGETGTLNASPTVEFRAFEAARIRLRLASARLRQDRHFPGCRGGWPVTR